MSTHDRLMEQRDMLERAIELQPGAEVTGGGYEMTSQTADFCYRIGGHSYWVEISESADPE